MGWKVEAPAAKAIPVEDLLKRERMWWSSYNEPERWIKDMKEVFYHLVGEYEIEPNLILLRFELDEAHRGELVNPPHFQNVIIDTSLPPVSLSEVAISLQKKK